MITNAAPVIGIDRVTKKYEDIIAVDDLSLFVKQGELFAFLGPNGAGKTTTIKMITGLLEPTAGHIMVKGMDVADNAIEAKRIMSYIPDFPFLYDKLTADEFMHFVSGVYGMIKGPATENKIDELLQVFGLYEIRDRLIESYSHGLRQRLVFACALVHDPEVLVVDEPMIGLDPESARLVKDMFKELTRQGKTVFMSTHTLSVAEELADRVGIIHKGKLIALGTQAELQHMSGKERKNLEEIFLVLTKDETVPEQV